MSLDWTRRSVLAAGGAALPDALGASADTATTNMVKIIGVSCSPRKDRTTAASVRVALAAAKAVAADIETEFIDLGGLKMNGDVAAGIPVGAGERDDFPKIETRLSAANVSGIIVGTPVYFSNMSSLCKAFLDRWIVFREGFALRNKVGGALAVAGARNGGQEMTLQCIHAAMLCHDMIIVTQGPPAPRLGGILVSTNDDVSKDETGLASARGLGTRVAEMALLLHKGRG